MRHRVYPPSRTNGRRREGSSSLSDDSSTRENERRKNALSLRIALLFCVFVLNYPNEKKHAYNAFVSLLLFHFFFFTTTHQRANFMSNTPDQNTEIADAKIATEPSPAGMNSITNTVGMHPTTTDAPPPPIVRRACCERPGCGGDHSGQVHE